MAPSPGTPLGGERPRRRAPSPAASSAAVMEVDSAPAAADAAPPGRLVCPVLGCPCADASRHPGWTSEATLRAHVDVHLAGALAGEVPAAWLAAGRPAQT